MAPKSKVTSDGQRMDAGALRSRAPASGCSEVDWMGKIIIDTDLGDDIDDAFAIAYAVKSGLEIAGITTVFRNAHARAEMAAKLLRTLGRSDIPVHAGLDMPRRAPIIARANDRYEADGRFIPCQYDASMSGEPYAELSAVDYLIETIRREPDNVTVLLIGPETNMAAAIEKAPDVVGKVKEVVVMGGQFFGEPVPEWNILCDPEAAAIVFSSGIPIRAVGLDVTMQCRLSGDQLERLRMDSAETSTLLCSLMDRWFAHYRFETPVLHDPVSFGVLLVDYVDFVNQAVQVGTELDGDYGATKLQVGAHPVCLAKTVRQRAFLDDFIAVLCG